MVTWTFECYQSSAQPESNCDHNGVTSTAGDVKGTIRSRVAHAALVEPPSIRQTTNQAEALRLYVSCSV